MLVPLESTRLDKWLWAVRLFRSRSKAGKDCESGQVRSDGRVLKAASTLRGNEIISLPFQEGPGTRVVRVLSLIDRRVGAALARQCYEDLTPPNVSEIRRVWMLDRSARREGSQGRPTKKDRREIERHRFFD